MMLPDANAVASPFYPLRSATRLLVLGAGLLFASPAMATYVYTPISGPAGTTNVSAWGINDSGQIVGNSSAGAFLYSGGTYQLFGDANTSVVGINNAGIVASTQYNAATETFSGRLLNTNTGIFTDVTVPGAVSVNLRGIANDGSYSGSWTDAGGISYAFINVGGVFTNLPGVSDNGFNVAQGINSFGQVVGSYSSTSSFLYDRNTGVFTNFSVTPANPNRTRARGINDHGVIAGFYNEVGGTQGFIGTAAGFQTLNYGSYAYTVLESLNNAGQVVGFGYDIVGEHVAFLATPAAMPTGGSPGAYTFTAEVIAGVPIFIDPEVATGYDYATGVGDPRIGQVRLPNNIGDNLYSIILPDGNVFIVEGGDLFDFTTHGFLDGVTGFGVRGIETSAGLNPGDPTAFNTQLVFLGSGTFTGSMVAVTEFVPEPASIALFGLGLLALGLRRKRAR